MKIALAQLNYHIGNFEYNYKKILEAIKNAGAKNVDLIVFSELSISGYPPLDLLEYKRFIQLCEENINKLAQACKNIAAIIGSPSLNTEPKGKKLNNSAYVLYDGKVQQVIHKTLLPTYDIFDEYRYFEPNKEFLVVPFKGKKIALTICEDIWYDQPIHTDFDKNKLYRVSPLKELAKQNPDFIINISASPFSYRQEENKRHIFTSTAKKYGLPLIYVNQVGAHTELIFDGSSVVVNSHGDIVKKLSSFEEDIAYVEVQDINRMPLLPEPPDRDTIPRIHDAIILGIQDYFAKMGFKKATLGLSGGIDSAVTLDLAVKALGNDNIRVLLMPSKYSSEHSLTDAKKLAENLNVGYDVIPINGMVDSFDEALKAVFEGLEEDITEENIQARIRGTLLMAVSNKFGHILLNTSNKSEAAVGYGTLYGDMNGGLSILGDVYKSDVFRLARYINRDHEIIPENIITKPPSAELRPDQKDTDSLPDYEILDKVLYQYIELRLSAAEIISKGADKDLVHWVVKRVNQNEFKRFQAPPILRVSSKAFGIGRRMPLVAIYPE